MAIPANRQIHVRLLVGRTDGLTWVDLSDYLSRVEINLGDTSGGGAAGVDAVVRQMEFTLRNEGTMMPTWDADIAQDESYIIGDETTVIGDENDSAAKLINLMFGTQNKWARNSFSPRDKTSSWNYFNGQYAPLLWPNREVAFDVAVTNPGVQPIEADWIRLFHGYLGDRISIDGPMVSCSCRDLAKRLQDTYIEEVREYGSEAGTPAETVIQQILDDNLGTGQVLLYCPVSPGFMIKPYKVEYQSVWDAIQQIASQIGWFLGYRWDPNQDLYRLTFMEPPRTKSAETADFILDWQDDFYAQELDLNDADIRNVVKITYLNREKAFRQSVTIEDQASIDEYGRRAMQIEEGDTSLIDTEVEATNMAQAVLSDLKDLTGTTKLDMPLLPTMDIFSGIVVRDPRISSTDDFYGVESVRHSLDFETGRFRTEVIASGHVVGAHTKWLRMETRPGSPASLATKLVDKYSWQDHFLRYPYDLSLWQQNVSANAGFSDGTGPHILRLFASPGTAGGTEEVGLNAVIAGSRELGIKRHIMTFRAKLKQPQASVQFAYFDLVERTPSRSKYYVSVRVDSLVIPARLIFLTAYNFNSYPTMIPFEGQWDMFHDFKIIITDANASLYIDDQLKAVHTVYVPPNTSRLAASIGVKNNVASTTYDMEIDHLTYVLE